MFRHYGVQLACRLSSFKNLDEIPAIAGDELKVKHARLATVATATTGTGSGHEKQ
jgi:hypothetical protein